jgi:peptidoglycan/xylan/chitin deacetylase (PgdA/CDA1 family)
VKVTGRRRPRQTAHWTLAAMLLALAVAPAAAAIPTATTRGPLQQKQIALVFTGHEFAEGGETILDALSSQHARASFFLTGEFLANTNFGPIVRRIVADGHYLGPHSDRHLLYCAWEKPYRTLVTREQFRADLLANLAKIYRLGVPATDVPILLPPYEHYNADILTWSRELNLRLVNFTPGTRSNADYTGEPDRNFVSSQAIHDSILSREKQDPNGLNGFILLLHIGSGPGRADKFHVRLPELLRHFKAKGYSLVRVDALLEMTSSHRGPD